MAAIEYTCEGCGVLVIGFGRGEPPAHQLCAVCAWCCECIATDEIMEVRRRCEPGGWQSERTLRQLERTQ